MVTPSLCPCGHPVMGSVQAKPNSCPHVLGMSMAWVPCCHQGGLEGQQGPCSRWEGWGWGQGYQGCCWGRALCSAQLSPHAEPRSLPRFAGGDKALHTPLLPCHSHQRAELK